MFKLYGYARACYVSDSLETHPVLCEITYANGHYKASAILSKTKPRIVHKALLFNDRLLTCKIAKIFLDLIESVSYSKTV